MILLYPLPPSLNMPLVLVNYLLPDCPALVRQVAWQAPQKGRAQGRSRLINSFYYDSGVYIYISIIPLLSPLENVFRQFTKMRRAEQVYSPKNAFLSPFSFFTLKSLFFNFFPAAIKPPNVMFFIVKMELVNPFSRIRI